MAVAARAAASSFLRTPRRAIAATTCSSSVAFVTAPTPHGPLRAAAVGAPPLLSRPRHSAPIVSQLPTKHPEVVSGEKKVRWSSRAIRSFAMAELEARKLRYPKTGTEALLMGILAEGTSDAARLLRANGITLLKVREEAVNILGKSELLYYSPLSPPLTGPAQRAIDWAVNEKLKSGEDGEVTANHLLLGIWSDKEASGHKILANLGFDDEKASLLAETADREVVTDPR